METASEFDLSLRANQHRASPLRTTETVIIISARGEAKN